MPSRFILCATILATAWRALPLRAEAVNFSDALPFVTTGTSTTRHLHLPKFDPSLGVLQSIELMITGRLEGTLRFENKDLTPRTINMDLSARLELFGPDSASLGFVEPLVSITRNAPGYDGTTDFGGDSGETIAGLSESISLPPILFPVGTYGSMFTGLDTVALPVTATGQSHGSGGGNVLFFITTLTSAEATVIYTYALVPEPAGFALVVLCVFACRRRRRF